MLTATSPDDVVISENTFSSGLREKLKTATAAAHHALDARFGTFVLTSRTGYCRFLEANAAALLPLETALERSDIVSVFADWPERSRRAAIAADLDRIGGTANPLPPVVTLGRQEMLGVMYVLEGSRLGAKYLLRTVAGCGEPQIEAATNYLRHGNGLPLWRSFLEKLEREPVTPHGEAEMISGAQLAFSMCARAAGA